MACCEVLTTEYSGNVVRVTPDTSEIAVRPAEEVESIDRREGERARVFTSERCAAGCGCDAVLISRKGDGDDGSANGERDEVDKVLPLDTDPLPRSVVLPFPYPLMYVPEPEPEPEEVVFPGRTERYVYPG